MNQKLRKRNVFEKDIPLAKKGDINARNRIICANLGLVKKVAGRTRARNLCFRGLFQSGVFGLFRAIEDYDSSKDIQFSTYATWKIRDKISKEVEKYDLLIRLPKNKLDARSLFRKENKKLYPFESFCNHFNLPYVDNSVICNELSSKIYSPEEQVINLSLKEKMSFYLKSLPIDEQYLIKSRFDFPDVKFKTLKELGKEFGITYQAVEAREKKILKKLKRMKGFDNLKVYLRDF